LGSASFPFFGPHQYKGRYLLDGGIANNLPLHLVFQESVVRQVLAIDLATFMRYHPRQLILERKYGHRTHFLRVGLDLPSPASFSRSSVDQMIERGRADALAWWKERCAANVVRDMD
jgi:predicted acylesterase/phospholipase RssA